MHTQQDMNELVASLLSLIVGSSTEEVPARTADEAVVILRHLGLQEEHGATTRNHLVSILMHMREIDTIMQSKGG